MKYILKVPVKLGEHGEPIQELTFREKIVAGDLRGIKFTSLMDPTSDDLLKIAGRLCAQPDPVMNVLEMADFLGVMEIVGGFLAAGLPTGTK